MTKVKWCSRTRSYKFPNIRCEYECLKLTPIFEINPYFCVQTMFHTLQKAIGQKTDYVFAEDVSATGKKQFHTGTIAELQTIVSNRSTRHFYECLMEHRASRLFLDVDSTSSLDIHELVELLRAGIVAKFKQHEPNIQILDSSGPNKYSWHIIVTNVILKNVYHVGAFVRRLVLYMADSPLVAAIDTAVYTRNRMFRLEGSSKMGSSRVLRSLSEVPWWELLVQVSCAHPLICLEIDETEPVSTSQKPHNLFTDNGNGTWSPKTQRTHGGFLMDRNPLLTPILDWLDKYEQAKIIRHKIKLLETGYYVVPANSRKCYIANRTHKGNAIWYMIDLTEKKIYQRCLDDDCGKRRHLMNVPAEVWHKWSDAWMSVEPPSNNQNTLYNISY